MKEIEFKVWCEFEINGEINKCMESPASWFLLTQTGKLWVYGPTSRPQPIEKQYKKAIPLFYIGVKDKDGKKIFDGDIVKLKRDKGFAMVKVQWEEDEAGFVFKFNLGWECPDETKCSDREIIGNIYENPELLEEQLK